MPNKVGRPKKIPVQPPTDIQVVLAEVLSNWCGVPGCLPRNHFDEVRQLEKALEENGFYIVTKRVN